MIKVNFFSDSASFGYDISGHAYYSSPGTDIICAAVSSLHLSLLSVLEADGHSFSFSDGEVKKVFASSPDAFPFFRLVYMGFLRLSAQFPDFISIYGSLPANR